MQPECWTLVQNKVKLKTRHANSWWCPVQENLWKSTRSSAMNWHLTVNMFLMSTINTYEKPIGAYFAYLPSTAERTWIHLPGDASGTRDFSKAWCSTSTVTSLCFNLSRNCLEKVNMWNISNWFLLDAGKKCWTSAHEKSDSLHNIRHY